MCVWKRKRERESEGGPGDLVLFFEYTALVRRKGRTGPGDRCVCEMRPDAAQTWSELIPKRSPVINLGAVEPF